jgi:hypothetical protein
MSVAKCTLRKRIVLWWVLSIVGSYASEKTPVTNDLVKEDFPTENYVQKSDVIREKIILQIFTDARLTCAETEDGNFSMNKCWGTFIICHLNYANFDLVGEEKQKDLSDDGLWWSEDAVIPDDA